MRRGVHEDFAPGNRGGIANLAFVVGGSAVAVVDSGGSRAEGDGLLAAVRARTPLPVAYVINTHLHPDHVLGNAAFRGETRVAFVGHERLGRRLADAGPHYLASMRRILGEAVFAGTEVVPPTLAVQGRLELDLGGRTLELRAWPTAHTDTDLTVLDRATGTLLAGDLVFLERIPVLDGSLKGWLGALDELAGIGASRVVPGHGPASSPWPDALGPQREYLTGLRDGVRRALARNLTLDAVVREIPVPAARGWLLAEENHPRNVTAGFTELEWE